jgi:hypothetical protein
MPVPDTGIHVLGHINVDGRVKPGHDDRSCTPLDP